MHPTTFPPLVAGTAHTSFAVKRKQNLTTCLVCRAKPGTTLGLKWYHRQSSNDQCYPGLLPHTEQTANRWKRATRAVSQKQLHKCLSYAIVSLPCLLISVQVCVCGGGGGRGGVCDTWNISHRQACVGNMCTSFCVYSLLLHSG